MIIILVFLCFFYPTLYANDETFVESQNIKTWKEICDDNKQHTFNYWFDIQLKKHRCDNHQQLSTACTDSTCFCKKSHSEKQYEINRTLLCALHYWQTDYGMDYIIWHELARIRKNPTVIQRMKDNDCISSLFSYTYLTRIPHKNRVQKAAVLTDFSIKFQERLALYRSPIWTCAYNLHCEPRWWVRNIVFNLRPRVFYNSTMEHNGNFKACLSKDGLTLGVQNIKNEEEIYFPISSGIPFLTSAGILISNKPVDKPDNFVFAEPILHESCMGTYLDETESNKYSLCVSMPSDQTLMGEIYTLGIHSRREWTYEPLHTIAYDQRHHKFCGQIPGYAYIPLWRPLKPSCSPQVRLIMEAVRGYANKPIDMSIFKRRNTFGYLWEVPWQAPRFWLKNLLDKVYKPAENAVDKSMLTYHINQQVPDVDTKIDVLETLYNKYKTTLEVLGLTGLCGILTGIAHKIVGMSYVKSFMSSFALTASRCAYILYQSSPKTMGIGGYTGCYEDEFKDDYTPFVRRSENTTIPSPIIPMAIIPNEDI
ncbi:MAG TPA: hypothetical protein VGW78_02120 [Candidatus Babeliales bacterium]|jgi:hypothetical protein|nr:hypothetical protein [Candidatus Babeliales bacterium]